MAIDASSKQAVQAKNDERFFNAIGQLITNVDSTLSEKIKNMESSVSQQMSNVNQSAGKGTIIPESKPSGLGQAAGQVVGSTVNNVIESIPIFGPIYDALGADKAAAWIGDEVGKGVDWVASEAGKAVGGIGQTLSNFAGDVANFFKDPGKEIGRALGSGVLMTACYKFGYSTKQDLKDLILFRLIKQKKEWLADQAWSGYQVVFRRFTSDKYIRVVYHWIVSPWTKHIRYSIDKGKFNLHGYFIHKILSTIGIMAYLLNKQKCKEIIDYYKGKSLFSIYRPIFSMENK